MIVSNDSFKLYHDNELRPHRSSLNRYALRHKLENNSVCVGCGLNVNHGWVSFGKKVVITLQLDHINGNKNDERLENRRYLCAICHSATDTYGGKNKGYKNRLG
jgi:hypothetical protein